MTTAVPVQFAFPPPEIDPSGEAAARAVLTVHYAESYKDRLAWYVDTLMATEPFLGRFQYFMTVIDRAAFRPDERILVSGCGSGSEMIVARQVGFGTIDGVEVEQIWLDVCERRLSRLAGMSARLYDGAYLPYPDNTFTAVVSGHVIEHTANPSLYLRECMRVLAPGGHLSLEFPNRYHRKELHTGLPSLEWLPSPLRNTALRALSSKLSPLTIKTKAGYHSIVSTRLKQISMTEIERSLRKAELPYRLLDRTIAAPGIIRCVIHKIDSRAS